MSCLDEVLRQPGLGLIPVFPIRDLLPQPGTSSELPELDFKRKIDASDILELAKDVAALANTAGGSIVIGAETRGGQTLVEYCGITEPEARLAQPAYEQAARDHCRPSPYVETLTVPLPEGTVVLVVNVWLAPYVPVGVRLRSREHADVRLVEQAWVFPRRVGSQTQYLQPDQFGVLDSMTARRVAALLLAIPEGQRQQVRLAALQTGSPPNLLWDGTLESVSLSENVAVFRVAPQAGGTPALATRVPLDFIETVWRDSQRGRWEVVLDTRVFLRRENAELRVLRWPPAR